MHFLLTGGNSEIVHKPAMQDDPQRRKPDISIAKQHINWEPKVRESRGEGRGGERRRGGEGRGEEVVM